MSTRKEILKILTIVKKTCLPSREMGAPEQGAGRWERRSGERGDGRKN
ncbi:hypothetical protein BH695_4563 [Microcystis aeruginosa PCC 7806SL]|uniref:Uncharacterized protein n=1 Tax=Microcystis aeruginosa PCC 7806SL TaxID=1903187 RepID=A0AB33BV59_MICA7|nr:hypothetical protein BH695_4563 [Microcystis aeruginosa PCC 7806SL]